MSSLIYDSCIYGIFRSTIHFDIDSFKMMLVNSDYQPSKGHAKRSDVRNEVVPSGGGYTQGGIPVKIIVTKNTDNNRVDIHLGEAVWTDVSITASGAIYYKATDSGASNDDLICFVEFERETESVDGGFKVTESVLRVQN